MSALSDESAKLQVIADTYGYNAQSRQIIEEMAELTQAINKFWRKEMKCGNKLPITFSADNDYYFNLVEEIADVEICIEQIKYLLGCSKMVGNYISEKIDRQIERIKRESEDN